MSTRTATEPSAAAVMRPFEALMGKPCWNVKRGYGTFLTLEFGEPHLWIREPIVASADASDAVRRSLARRSVSVRGDWHLWIYCCMWEVRGEDSLIGDWTSRKRIDRAAQFLNGQKLTSVRIAPRGVRTSFRFDLGGRLETAPYDRSSEQWLLYEPGGTVLTVRAGRRFSHEPGSRAHGETEWLAF